MDTIKLLELVSHRNALENDALTSCHLLLFFCPMTGNSFFKTYNGSSATKALRFFHLPPLPLAPWQIRWP